MAAFTAALTIAFALTGLVVLLAHTRAHRNRHLRKRKVAKQCYIATLILEAWCDAHPNERVDDPIFKKLAVNALMLRLAYYDSFGEEYDGNTAYLRTLAGNGVQPLSRRRA